MIPQLWARNLAICLTVERKMTLLSTHTQKSKSFLGCWRSPNIPWISSEYWRASDNIFSKNFMGQTIPESRDGLHLALPRLAQLRGFSSFDSQFLSFRLHLSCVGVFPHLFFPTFKIPPVRVSVLAKMPDHDMINENTGTATETTFPRTNRALPSLDKIEKIIRRDSQYLRLASDDHRFPPFHTQDS
jgi:hypothetical protein